MARSAADAGGSCIETRLLINSGGLVADDERGRHMTAAVPAGAQGPLDGVKILEFGSIGPGPFAATVLAGLGADLLRLHRPGDAGPLDIGGAGADKRGRPGLAVDLKDPRGRRLATRLASAADAVLEGFRPGVMERLGLGPADLMAVNPRLVYTRITGYGQDGPMAQVPGHDINYVAMSGVLSAIGRRGERPLPPLNLVADYGGGGMLAALGVVSGILSARQSGQGRVVDAAMVDGVAQLALLFYSFAGAGAWEERGTNVLDTGAHFYEVYETADGGYMAVGAIEPQFYAELLRILEVPAEEAPQWRRELWPDLKLRFAEIFATRTRAEWTRLSETADACTTPVLTLAEAPAHPHHVARQSFRRQGDACLPAPAPRFSGVPPLIAETPPDTAKALPSWGLSDGDIDVLRASGAIK
jgi:alpha-methylacyl-CoA racemase